MENVNRPASSTLCTESRHSTICPLKRTHSPTLPTVQPNLPAQSPTIIATESTSSSASDGGNQPSRSSLIPVVRIGRPPPPPTRIGWTSRRVPYWKDDPLLSRSVSLEQTVYAAPFSKPDTGHLHNPDSMNELRMNTPSPEGLLDEPGLARILRRIHPTVHTRTSHREPESRYTQGQLVVGTSSSDSSTDRRPPGASSQIPSARRPANSAYGRRFTLERESHLRTSEHADRLSTVLPSAATMCAPRHAPHVPALNVDITSSPIPNEWGVAVRHPGLRHTHVLKMYPQPQNCVACDAASAVCRVNFAHGTACDRCTNLHKACSFSTARRWKTSPAYNTWLLLRWFNTPAWQSTQLNDDIPQAMKPPDESIVPTWWKTDINRFRRAYKVGSGALGKRTGR